ncbi:MAG: methyltransferase [Candidatus Sphingomonas phytovorans]|nr:methyltransferase [Sphingomonas sp.]WEK00274.1 MAG: methyltransferase [Sphingomonas sp.]
MRLPFIVLSFACLSVAGIAVSMPLAPTEPILAAAVKSSTRTPANIARDQYRHPAETLAFFDVKPTDSVVEIWPGGGWYTEILAPYLAAGGKLTIVSPPGRPSVGIGAKLDKDVATYGKVARANFPSALGGTGVAPGTADKVLTFRNVHNWRMGYLRPDKMDYSAAAFREIYAMLKPGGVLGIEDHRLPENADNERERTSGYIKVSTIRKLAEDAGFQFAGASEVNANPKDTHNWPEGVWTLPPSLQLGDKDREKYVSIGESDRMTLKFVKPAK